MLKEAIICIVIVVAIFVLEIFTQNFTRKTVQEITEIFKKLEESISNQDIKQINDEIQYIDRKWEEEYRKLAYYIEHDELEKVSTAIATMKSYIKSKEYTLAMAELEEGKFVLEHIQDKKAFNFQNIF